MNQELILDIEEAIVTFEKSHHPGVWPHLNKIEIIQQLKERLINPFYLRQGGQPLCGPASVVFELIRKQPIRYVKICHNLFENGSFQSNQKIITASTKLRSSHGNLRMAEIDWMLLATLRDFHNLIVPLDPQSPTIIRNLAGITKPWELTNWIQELLGYQTQYLHTYRGVELVALNKAKRIIAQGGIAIALINSQGLLEDNPPFQSYPSHWITLLGNFELESDDIKFDLYSWGRKITLNIPLTTLSNYLWGIIIAN